MDRHLQRHLQRGHKRDHQGQNRLKLHVFCNTMHGNLNFRILPPTKMHLWRIEDFPALFTDGAQPRLQRPDLGNSDI